MKNKILLILFFLSFLILTCEKEKPEPLDISSEITITTAEATDIEYRSANISGTLSDNYGHTIQDYGHCWDTLQNPGISKSILSYGNIKESKQFTSQLQDLISSKKYYAKAYFIIDNVAVYSDEITFNTKPLGPPVLTTASITDITAISATSGGNIIEDGGFPLLYRGVCWNTTENPTIKDIITSDGEGIGSFTSQLTGLDLNTTYYVKAYAISSIDTGYGNQKIFITKDGIPILTTNNITNITATSATSGGNIADDGGFPITARGICWSTSVNPTLADSYTIDGSGIGSFTSNIIGLSSGITYYVRAYATTSAGTAYGDQFVFIALKPIAYFPFNGNANDESGNELHGSVEGATLTKDRFGNLQSAYYFDGDDYIETPSCYLAPSSLTVSIWIYPSGKVNGQTIIDHRAPYVTSGWELRLAQTNYPLGIGLVIIESPGEGNEEYLWEWNTIENLEWQHIVGTFNGTGMKLYVNGELKAESNLQDFNYTEANTSLWIGKNHQPGIQGTFMGIIDDIKVYDQALNETAIKTLFHENGW
jgi:hypothetical protein